jgi:osmotically-inducible protein OsmY
MKKAFAAAFLSAALISSLGCGSNWSRVTPDKYDDTAIEAEIRKHMSTDGLSGMSIKSHDGVVTLEGDVKSEDQHQKALADARVGGVKSVVDKIVVKP